MHADALLYLSLVSLPEGMSRVAAATLLAQAGLGDEYTLRERLGPAPPLIVGQYPATDALAASETLRAAGADAFVCSLADVESLGPTLKIKHLELMDDAGIRADMWRGETLLFAPSDIRLLIRASVRKITSRVNTAAVLDPGPSAIDIAVSPEFAIARRLAHVPEPTRIKSINVSEKLDIHLAEGRVLQLDGDKFGFAALGPARAHADKVNMDQMLTLLRGVSPAAVVDDFFQLWRPPPNITRFRIPQMKMNNDDPAFAFYSRWAALMYRHIQAGR